MFIRPEQPGDYKSVEQVVESAFRNAEMSDHTEHLLVRNLRHTDAYLPLLSLIAQNHQGDIIGHVMLSKITIGDGEPSLALAPISVLPNYQGKGVGTQLMQESIAKAKAEGYRSIIVLGAPEFYLRFDFEKAIEWQITAPFEGAEPYLLALELVEGALDNVRGEVHYSKAFNL
ncbi:GNAT family N-acetyltransferase [Staphylococcus simulans]|uniref:GNAT family N-acetyltransferase n=1 Tax=Staphylococcus simulans TaxID=1286 RepID=UPI000D0278C8|nr:N-acetyltransferase [Staphylococcus simulans]